MMKVLVVDGHTEKRRAIVDALSRLEGLSVQCSIADLETASRVLLQYTPDILVIGTELADGDGLLLVEKVRRPGMSIVVIGPAESRDVWRRYLAAGADRFVEPDGELEELQVVVRALVRQLGPRLDAPPSAAGRATVGIVRDFNNHILALELILEVLERSPGEKHLWNEARIAIERVVSLTALLLGDRGPRRRAPLLARGALGGERAGGVD